MAEGQRARNRESESNLYKRKGQWYARVKINGRDQRRSLRTSVKAVALKKLRRFLDEVEHVRSYGEERHTWKNAVVEWSVHAKGGIKPSVLDRYKISLANCRPILDTLYVDEINFKTISKIIAHRKTEKVTNATIRRDLTAMSSVLAFCVSKGWLETNAAKTYDRSTIRERRDPVVLPELDDIEAIVKMAEGNFGKAIRYAQYTGMREEEIFSLTPKQVREGVTDLWKTKTDSPRAVPNDKRAQGTLKGTDSDPEGKWVFWVRPGERYQNVASRFCGFTRRALKAKKIKNRFTFHHLRHWFAVDYLRSGGNIYALQQILGHASIKTTELYLRFLTPDQQQRAKYGQGGTNAAQ